jgi:GT2 family glycosyltransferase
VRAVDRVTFGGVLIRRKAVDECGPIDGRYEWAYVMDVDYCFKGRSGGYQLFQVPVYLQHEGSRTTQTASNGKMASQNC